MTLAVNEPSEDIQRLQEQWRVLEQLNGGTPAMRKAATERLPRWPNEENDSYQARLATATLFPAYERTVSVMSGKPFSKSLTLDEKTPESIVTWSEDIDQQGVSLHAFAAEMFTECFYGLAGVLVDYPSVPPPADGVRTVAQVEATGARPYFVRVKHNQILGCRSEVVAGRMRLTMLRLLESYEEPDGDWGTVTLSQVRVLRPGSWEVWRQVGRDNRLTWQLFDSGYTTLKDIPFVPFYGKRESFMVGAPPLLSLGYLNVKHWQSQSDQDTILHVARVPILAVIGVDDDKWQLTVGASTAVKLPVDGDMKFVEHSGAAIKAGAESLADLESQMVQTGAELLVKGGANTTVVGDSNDAEANKSDLQRMAESFEDALNQALQFMADYARLPSGGSVSLFKDFGAATLSDASASLVKDLQAAGIISKETTINELKRRGVLDETVDAAEELEKVAEDGPPLGMMTEFGLGPDGKPLPKDDDEEEEAA